ncbi:protein NO VEIN domain-containing protein [Tsukamurella tyrosinosolvens]|uniref:protein NO VEIN domain-containing protein n=1 Tax=Tsukamurella tyrosinosolvens TaxID=57704 RepID=UPI002DD4447B|nr:DUF3883 domain-containing protein [Tsukamurella tyrosinosolvens]MEC4613816.1 DUF3883 domain-containing protein [Tsukamurella tyrosinosolvens]
MAYWWANQGNNFAVAIEQRTLWTCPRADGRRTPDRECIKDMQTDDIVFHYAQGEIRAVSRVTQDWRPARRPAIGYETDSDDHDEGWLVRVEPIVDDLHVPLDLAAAVVAHGRKYGPLDKNGDVNQKFLFPLEPHEGEQLLDLASVDADADGGGVDSAAPPALWMEIRRDSNTLDFGASLHASREKIDGSRKPAFERVRTVRPGDRVLHWWQKAIVGVSVVAGTPVESPDAVDVALRDFVRFPVPITLDDLRAQADQIASVYQATRGDARWSQFPFQIDHADSAQPSIHGAPTTYFAPFPGELLDAIVGLAAQVDDAQLVVNEDPTSDQEGQPTRVAYESDPARRKAVEVRAEEVAIKILEAEGYELVGRPGKPYDLAFVRGEERLHVEVKGSSVAVDAVILTRNEVTHASEHTTTLIVVDQIEVRLGADGEYECRNGRPRRWDAWVPAPEALTALQHSYILPPKR